MIYGNSDFQSAQEQRIHRRYRYDKNVQNTHLLFNRIQFRAIVCIPVMRESKPLGVVIEDIVDSLVQVNTIRKLGRVE